MITELSLRNFKAWSATGKVKLGPISCFFGSNSSGKTSLLQSLLLLKQTAISADRGRVFDLGGSDSSLVSLGTFYDLVYGHATGENVEIDVSWEEDEPFSITDTEARSRSVIAKSSSLGLEVEVSVGRNQPAVQRVVYKLGDYDFSLSRREGGKYRLSSNGYKFRRVTGRAWPLPPPGKFYSFPDQVRSYYQNAAFLSDLELNFEQFCGRIYYLGPLRQDPQRQYLWGGGRPVDVGRRGELAVEAMIASQADGKTNSRGFVRRKNGALWALPRISVEQHVASWLKELNLISDFSVEPLDRDRESVYRVLVRRGPSDPPVLLTDVGFGVSQVLPVLVLLAYVPEGSTVLLEQPEIHLHPAVQSGLADVIIEAAKVRKLQVIVESHSEHLLLRLQRRIAEKFMPREIEITSEDCHIYFCDSRQGAPTIERLNLDLFGNVTNWPADFFGDGFGEAAAQAKAARRRMKEERGE
ncbi:DUF3696 domain-containing protein [Amycolatopsis sp. AA4]|uniref:AAA family ATPase n=1 Tax=Actinomycetes TaxID=1760 RepID=UPI0001B5510F|nr:MULTISPECIES: DUF3696 domain-containing protein [Actinomycetes]ATY14551.1 DUF3696 domain-containing protein [Amycolatopsis sp. AA4]EFL10655.1 predicted protein [Streptomyces sp. AA4]